ncbi:MAG: DNA mismatch repair endonuclease MutL, partial [Nanoarchaeota archaeon]
VGNSAAGVPKGTIIEVRDLFFNTPARLKFMKTDTNELKHIVDIVTRYALINPKVSIRLQHNGHSLVNSPTSEDMLNNISSIYGNDVAKQLLEVKYEDINVYVTGYISKPSLLKSDKSMQSLYVNGRYVKDDTVEKALYDAYHTLLFVDRHPVVILNIRVDPTVIDVNIHPTKEKVKFEQASKIYDSIFNSVRQTLLENSLITDFSSLDSSEQAILEEKKPEKPKAEIRREKGYIYISKENQTFVLPDVQPSEAEMYSAGLLSKSEWKEKKLQKGNAKLPDMRLVGQVMKTFFLAETAEGLLIIDQHVVQERVLYERYMGQYMNKSISHQSLLSPLVVEVPPEDSVFLQANIDQVKSFGFDAEHFGDNSFTLRAVPSIFEKVETKQAFMDLVSELSANKSLSMEMKQEDIITRMACRASIKAGDDVTIPYMEGLLKELDACTLPYTCPHGRPIFIRFTLDDLEKM